MVIKATEVACDLESFREASLIVSTMPSGLVGEDISIRFDAFQVFGSFLTYGMIYLCHDLKCAGTIDF
jgi:hypothetical protein